MDLFFWKFKSLPANVLLNPPFCGAQLQQLDLLLGISIDNSENWQLVLYLPMAIVMSICKLQYLAEDPNIGNIAGCFQ